jgi:hypothetical protein
MPWRLTDDALVSPESASREVLRVGILLTLVQRCPSVERIVVDGFEGPLADKDGKVGLGTGCLSASDLGDDVSVDARGGDCEKGVGEGGKSLR